MKKTTHEIVSLCIFLIVSRFFEWDLLIISVGCVLAVFVGILSDILEFKVLYGIHRNFLTHSPISPLVPAIFFGFWFARELIQSGDFPLIFASIITAIFEIHIILDMLNPSGVPIIPGKSIRIKKIPYDDFKLNIILALVGMIFSVFGLFF